MIDVVATVLAWLRSDADLGALVGDQIASAHRYGAPDDAWNLEAAGLTLVSVPGERPDDAGQRRARLDLRAYAETPAEAEAITGQVQNLIDAFARTVVPLPSGQRALLYWVVADDSPEAGFDADTKLHTVRLPLRACVAASAV